MGGGQSVDRPDYMSFMARLSIKDYKNDETFWTELISLAPSRNDFPLPFPRLMNEIAIKYPQNFLRLVLICVQHINLLQSGDSAHLFPDFMLDQLSLSLCVFIACFEALVYNENLIPILNRLDKPLAQKYLENRPHLLALIKQSSNAAKHQSEKSENKSGNKDDNKSGNKDDNKSGNKNDNKIGNKNDNKSGNKNDNKSGNKNDNKSGNKNNNNNENKETKASTVAKANPILKAMKTHEGRAIESIVSALNNCLFKNGLTLEQKLNDWNQTSPNYKILNTTRRDIVHCFLFLSSLNYFLPSGMSPKPDLAVSFVNFPFSEFIRSTCLVAAKYNHNQYNKIAEPETLSLLLNCYGLAIRFFTNKEFQKAFSTVKPSILLDSMILAEFPAAPPLFNPLDPLATESIAFLYMSLLFQPKLPSFIAKKGLSNKFIFNLLYASQMTFEQLGICYVHSIIISSILLLVASEKVAQSLNQPFLDSLKCTFKPHIGTFADVLIETLGNVCENNNFTPSYASIFHMISPFVNSFSIFSAVKLMQIFEKSIETNPQLNHLFVSSFAEIVQKRNNKENLFRVLIVQKALLFKHIPKDDGNAKPIEIILKFIDEAKRILKKSKKTKMEIDEVKNSLIEFDVEKVFPEIVTFKKHPHIFGGELKDTWTEWGNLAFQKIFEEELNRMKSMKREIELQEIILSNVQKKNDVEMPNNEYQTQQTTQIPSETQNSKENEQKVENEENVTKEKTKNERKVEKVEPKYKNEKTGSQKQNVSKNLKAQNVDIKPSQPKKSEKTKE